MTESPSLLLQRAAQRLLEMSSDPMGPPQPWWEDHPEGTWGERREPQVCGRGKPLFTATDHATTSDVEWVATTSPAVAAPLVAWLREAASAFESYGGMPAGLMQSDETAGAYGHTYRFMNGALDFARSVLGEAPSE